MMRYIIPETFVSVEMQLLLFAGSCLMGIPCGMTADFFRFLRKILPHHTIGVLLEDIFCCTIIALLLAGYMTAFAKGDFINNIINYLLVNINGNHLGTALGEFCRNSLSVSSQTEHSIGFIYSHKKHPFLN